jgi:hypothetical protein
VEAGVTALAIAPLAVQAFGRRPRWARRGRLPHHGLAGKVRVVEHLDELGDDGRA